MRGSLREREPGRWELRVPLPPYTADAHSLEIGMLVRLAAALGARRGEVCRLRWGDIDAPAGTITIRRAVIDVAGKVHVKDTKTHAERVVAADKGTLTRLASHRRARRRPSTSGRRT